MEVGRPGSGSMRLVAVVDDVFSDVRALRLQDHQERLHHSRCSTLGWTHLIAAKPVRPPPVLQLWLPLRSHDFADVCKRDLAEFIQQSLRESSFSI